MIWGTRNEQIASLPIDLEAWQKCYNRNQQEYIRRRLRAIKLCSEGKSRTIISKDLGITYKTLSNYLDLYIHEGLDGLVKPISKPRLKLLNEQQISTIRNIVLHDSPETYLKKEIFGR